MKIGLVLVVLLANVTGYSQDPNFYKVQPAADGTIPDSIHSLCSQGYDLPTCGKPADRNIGLDLRPEVIEAMRNAWLRASLGNSPNEAGFYYNGTINPIAHTNQNGKLSFIIPQGTTAVFHTHPQGHDPMSQQDIDVANQNHVDMYVISRSGLYHYRPGMKEPEILLAGTDYLAKKKGIK